MDVVRLRVGAPEALLLSDKREPEWFNLHRLRGEGFDGVTILQRKNIFTDNLRWRVLPKARRSCCSVSLQSQRRVSVKISAVTESRVGQLEEVSDRKGDLEAQILLVKESFDRLVNLLDSKGEQDSSTAAAGVDASAEDDGQTILKAAIEVKGAIEALQSDLDQILSQIDSQELINSQSTAKLSLLEAKNERLQRRVEEVEAALADATKAQLVKEQPPAKGSVMVQPKDGERQEVEEGEGSGAVESRAPSTRVQSVPTPRGAKKIVPLLNDIRWPSPEEEPPFWVRSPRAPSAYSASSSAAKGKEAGKAGGVVARDEETFHIVHVTAEMAPLAKVGGLADVVTGLGRACLVRGHRVDVMLPFYDCMDEKELGSLTLLRSFGSFHRGDWIGVQAFEGRMEGVPLILLKPENHFFRGARIYGGNYNELEAYLFFSRACLEYMQVSGLQPDIIHVHEWHTAAVALLYWDMYHNLNVKKPRLLLTIHNMEHHGECRWEQLDMCGLDGRSYLTVEKAMDDRTIGHNPERLSLLKGGIVYSNTITTVSPTYAQETLCSGWLAATLLKYRQKYFGVLNGIDTETWDPETDPYLPAAFSAGDLDGKQICKHYLQRGLGLELELLPSKSSSKEFTSLDARRVPLVVCVTRLVAQKGIHLIRRAIFRSREIGAQFILLGSAPDGRIQGDFAVLSHEFKESKDIRLLLTYSESLAHLLYAAADMVLVPSMFEPCGLTQMIGMRYGAVPIVRKTGGLADTVFDVDDPAHGGNANGFVFDGIHEGALDSVLDRAVKYYKERPKWWADLTAQVLQKDNSWNKAAGEYVNLYNAIRVRW